MPGRGASSLTQGSGDHGRPGGWTKESGGPAHWPFGLKALPRGQEFSPRGQEFSPRGQEAGPRGERIEGIGEGKIVDLGFSEVSCDSIVSGNPISYPS